ncbi:hypothetical protein Strvi_4046 [Streptomyces violaceusniger Tu 4113]|uniref:Uncharacterized protein n=1 Tax=Streptomyces violaceusniger (strain Tu 4113) TaxID=653045 RepID=G2P4G6_STRV4|nr:hypothetical protein Strvi_4046 [Streptomyces violaceusniger Tu 4113]
MRTALRWSGGRGGRLSERAGRARRRFPVCGGSLKRNLRRCAADRGVQRRGRPGTGVARAKTRGEMVRAEDGGRGTSTPARIFSGIRYGSPNRGAAWRPDQLADVRTDLTRRLPYLLSCIAAPTAPAPRQFSEKSRSSWRPGTGGESRGLCIAGSTPPRISLPHIDFPPSSRSQGRPRNHHPSPRRPGTPGDAGDRAFPAISSAAPGKRSNSGSCRREAQRAYVMCRWSPAVRGGAFGVLRATSCRRTPGRGRMAEPGRAMKRRSGTGRALRSAPTGRSATRPPGGARGRVAAWRSLSS